MSRLPSRSTRVLARSVASSPAVAGFRPASAALAIATAFALQPVDAAAQTAVHGTATVARDGGNLTVTTTNGRASNHSVINWQSFSVPAKTITEFVQPGATSTSINRVTGNDPSQILGQLKSNGRLVLVNPAGITVGAGASVDTAGFTASTLFMSETDAIAGRMRFGGAAGGKLLVESGASIRAQGGDIVLIAPKVDVASKALVESDGATILAAGQKVEITGRGLEGIHMEVQAGNEAVNLGTLKGDAVGIFANTLRHSGLVHAQAVTREGGKVLLQAAGENAVSGTVIAQGARARGGSIDVFGERVSLTGAALDASGPLHGGSVRVGGDFQGRNAAVANAAFTAVDGASSIRADATIHGDGGRVIVWADDTTRMHGRISARGGPDGGNGGFAEVSGKGRLDHKGFADLRAPRGAAGTLLLDPQSIFINSTGTGTDPNASYISDTTLESQLAASDVTVQTANDSMPGGGDITVDADIDWRSGRTLTLDAHRNIILNQDITATDVLGNTNGGLILNTRGGSISQATATSVVTVRTLAMRTTNGSITMLANNQVDQIAAELVGATTVGNFDFKNARAIQVMNSLPGPPAATPTPILGLDAYDDLGSGFKGNVKLVTTAGGITVIPGANVYGAAVTLDAKTDLRIDGARVESFTGPLQLFGRNAIYIGRVPGTVTELLGPTIALDAETEIGVGTSSAPPTPAPSASPSPPTTVRITGGSGGVSLDTRGSIRFDAAAPGTSSFRANEVATLDGGNIHIHAIGGDVEFGFSTSVSAGGGGGIDVVSDAGSILGQGRFSTNGGLNGSVVLTATSLATEPTATTRGSGSISFDSIDTQGWGSGAQGGKVTVHAGRNVTGGTIRASGYQGSSAAAGDGGQIKVDSDQGSIVLRNAYADGGHASSGQAGHGGSILLTALGDAAGAGNITVLAPEELDEFEDWRATGLFARGGAANSCCSGVTGGNGGTVEVRARRTVVIGDTASSSVGARIAVYGGGIPSAGTASGGLGGHILLFSQAGDINMQGVGGQSALLAFGGSGWTGADGGTVTISAPNGRVLVDAIDVSGGDGEFSRGGHAGEVIVVSGGDMTLGDVFALGGLAQSGEGAIDAGNGGSINLESGGFVVAGLLNVEGGNSETVGAGGAAGEVIVSAAGMVDTGPIMADGGSSSGQHVGGHGGNVTIVAGGDILIRAGTQLGISADGGESTDDVGGEGGIVFVQSTGGSLIVTAPVSNVTDSPASSASPLSGIGAGGGSGVVGGKGGTVFVDARADLNLQLVDVQGGTPASAFSAAGGAGGTASLRFGGTMAPIIVTARGGDGSDGPRVPAAELAVVVEEPLNFNGGAGGKGGTLIIERVGGDLVLDGNSILRAGGGFGGSATSGQGGTGGTGGDGGILALLSTGGRVVLDNTSGSSSGFPVGAGGGLGGLSADGSRAPSGALGTFSAAGTSVEVMSPFFLDAVWSNSSIVNVRGSSSISGTGIFVNGGTLSLFDTASVTPQGGLVNSGRLASFGSNRADFSSNFGTVDVGAGSTLVAPSFTFNGGVLHVDGVLRTGADASTSGHALSAATPGGAVFTNAEGATLGGIGTLVVNGGIGTVDNFGTIAPGGSGTIGTFTIGGSLNMQPGSTVAFDLRNPDSHDVLKVVGTAITGGTFALNFVSDANFEAGQQFDILQATTIDASTPPRITPPEFEAQFNGGQFVLKANRSFPEPTPAPVPPPPGAAPAEPPSQTPAEAPPPKGPGTLEFSQNSGEVKQVTNTQVTFATLFLQEAERQQQEEAKKNEVGKDDIVLTDAACKP